MKTKNITLSLALAAVFSSSTAFAELEVTGKVVHESAMFTSSGQGIGATTTRPQTADTHGKDLFKTATHAKLFIDGDVPNVEDATMHVELNAFFDNKAIDSDNKYHENYTQRDILREAYIDAEKGDVSFRIGKQQVVWGTADGMKLLDAINPTDYTEMAQNQMEDSRIPIWMINAETDSAAGDGGSWQVILSEARGNKIAGLGRDSGKAQSHTNGDAGHPFLMKGVDSITGKVNGFLNVAPALGKVASFFVTAGGGRGGLYSFKGATVNDFAGNSNHAAVTSFRDLCVTTGGRNTTGATGLTDGACLSGLANDTNTVSGGNFAGITKGGNDDVTNLIQLTAAEFDADNPDTAFEYMSNATFATFASFTTADGHAGGLQSEYRVKDVWKDGANIGIRYKNSTPSGLNYSLNYMNKLDQNPTVTTFWEDPDGKKYNTKYLVATGCGAGVCADNETTVFLEDVDGDNITSGTERPTLVMLEEHKHISSFGGSFDTAVETAQLGPVVIRGEALFEKGVMTPVVDLARLGIGDLTGGLTMEKNNYFKYVVGADITALTNMMISAQFIQIANLDYIDTTHTPSDSAGTASNKSGKRYTGDMATMHMSNGFNKAEEFKEFYSLFLSKPFGASGEHRWNNIFMFEENGGKWNRLDAEFSINDDVQATVEVNSYFGDENTQFGQLKKSSNVQVGFKYSF
jgi:hypothetical protein